jgi:AcrR family transcriptional regulator
LEALTESSDASLNAIARRASVGNATLYRHFATKKELVLAAYQREVRKVIDAAGSFLRTQAPIDALRSWVERLASAIVGALDRLLQANISSGTLRSDLDAADVILALAGLWQLDPAVHHDNGPPAHAGDDVTVLTGGPVGARRIRGESWVRRSRDRGGPDKGAACSTLASADLRV